MNVNVKGDELVITIDMNSSGFLSKSGKFNLIGATDGFESVGTNDDGNEVYLLLKCGYSDW
jgi:hypothetical protein